MSEHNLTARARVLLGSLPDSLPWELHELLLNLMCQIRLLESVPPASPETLTEGSKESEMPSSPDTLTEAGQQPSWATSSTWSYPANPAGRHRRNLVRDISGWLNSALQAGGVQEAEIRLTLTPKDATLPTGSPSPSQQASGAAGESRELCECGCGHGEGTWEPSPAPEPSVEEWHDDFMGAVEGELQRMGSKQEEARAHAWWASEFPHIAENHHYVDGFYHGARYFALNHDMKPPEAPIPPSKESEG